MVILELAPQLNIRTAHVTTGPDATNKHAPKDSLYGRCLVSKQLHSPQPRTELHATGGSFRGSKCARTRLLFQVRASKLRILIIPIFILCPACSFSGLAYPLRHEQCRCALLETLANTGHRHTPPHSRAISFCDDGEH